MKKFCFFVSLLCCIFAFAGCTNSTSDQRNTATYTETVNSTYWEVTYDKDTREIVSIRTPLLIPNDDISSPFHFYMESNYNRGTFLCLYLSGTPTQKDVFRIEQKSYYFASATRDEWETIKQTFPSCTYSETSEKYVDDETREEQTIVSGSITFSEMSTTYEQKIIFTVPAV